jgi:hypothetical protein
MYALEFGELRDREQVGVSPRDRAAREAHDYAVDRFKGESELTVDTTTNEGRQDLIATLAE